MINYLKDQYYWYNINQKLNRFLKGKEDEKILMYGYPKSGNTWLRFLLYNYCNLLLNNEEVETISYNRLNILQNNIMDRGTTFLPEKGFPLFYRTHRINKRTYNLFDKKIFIASKTPTIENIDFNFVFAKDIFEHLENPSKLIDDLISNTKSKKTLLCLDLEHKGKKILDHLNPNLPILKEKLINKDFKVIKKFEEVEVWERS